MKYTTLKGLLADSCNAIREQDGTTEPVPHQDIPERIRAIQREQGMDTSLDESVAASPSDMAKNKKAFVNGELVTGSLPVYADAVMVTNDLIRIANKGHQIVANAKAEHDFILRSGCNINFEIDKSRFGDAEPSHVVDGKTFTSAQGFMIPGGHVCGSGGEVVDPTSLEAESLSNLHYWTKSGSGGKKEEETKTREATLTYGTANTIQYGDDVVPLGDGLALVNPKDYTITDEDDAQGVLRGKYVYTALNEFYRIPADATVYYVSPNAYAQGQYRVPKAYRIKYVAGTDSTTAVVVSTDSTLYPENGEQDGFTYVYQGTLGGQA